MLISDESAKVPILDLGFGCEGRPYTLTFRCTPSSSVFPDVQYTDVLHHVACVSIVIYPSVRQRLQLTHASGQDAKASSFLKPQPKHLQQQNICIGTRRSPRNWQHATGWLKNRVLAHDTFKCNATHYSLVKRAECIAYRGEVPDIKCMIVHMAGWPLWKAHPTLWVLWRQGLLEKGTASYNQGIARRHDGSTCTVRWYYTWTVR
jgi:hypothetical protein